MRAGLRGEVCAGGSHKTRDQRLFGDAIHGMDADDLLFGDDGLYGGPGNDTVVAVGDAPGDFVDCGAGAETVQRSFRSPHDVFVDCERLTG